MSAQSLDGGTDAAVGDGGVGDAALGDGGASDASVVDAQTFPYFTDMTASNFPPPPCADMVDAGSRVGCFTHWLTLSDLDSDGDLDVLFANGGGYYALGNAEPSTVYTNDGTGAFRDVTSLWFGGAMSRTRQVSVGDIDGDGDLDIYHPGSYGVDNDKLWVQTAKGVFIDMGATNLPGKLRSKSAGSHLADLDGDGDLDLVVTDWGDLPVNSNTLSQPANVWIYTNDGKGRFSQQPADTVPAPVPVVDSRTPIDVDTADIDGDFDLDLLINMRNNQSRIFINDGHGKFTDGTYTPVAGSTSILNYPRKNGTASAYVYNQELCDIDYDGDLDLLLDNAGRPKTVTSGRYTQININDGKGRFEDKSDDFLVGETPGDDNAVKCADVSGDGKYDILVAALQTRGEKVFVREADGKFYYKLGAVSLVADPTLGIDAADLDGDGVLDIVTGQGEGSNQVDRYYKGTGLSGKDVTPPTFRAIEEPDFIEPNQPIIIRFAPIDAHTSETGEHVKNVSMDYKVGTGARQTLKATFIGGDLFRVVIPGQPNGTMLTLYPSATDRAGLVSAPVEVNLLVGEPVVVEPVPDAGMPDTGVDPEPTVDSGTDPEPEVDAGDVEPEPEPEEDAGDVDPGIDEEPEPTLDAGTGGSTGGGKKDDGCSISAPGTSNTTSGLLFGLGLTLLAVRRSRIARRRS